MAKDIHGTILAISVGRAWTPNLQRMFKKLSPKLKNWILDQLTQAA